MTQSFWKMVNRVIARSDILLEVLDARLISETRNREVEDKVRRENKPLIYVINKCDLADRVMLERQKHRLKPSVYISSKTYDGINLLKERILIEAHKRKIKEPKVGVLGYPNVGKSSLINALKGKHAAATSPEAGFTKHLKHIKARRILLIDTPGVIPYLEKNEAKHIKIAAQPLSLIKEPDLAAISLMKQHPQLIERHYQITPCEDREQSLAEIALKYNMLMKGGKPDINRAARKILKDWQEGRIRH
jgi:hypothetical protein